MLHVFSQTIVASPILFLLFFCSCCCRCGASEIFDIFFQEKLTVIFPSKLFLVLYGDVEREITFLPFGSSSPFFSIRENKSITTNDSDLPDESNRLSFGRIWWITVIYLQSFSLYVFFYPLFKWFLFVNHDFRFHQTKKNFVLSYFYLSNLFFSIYQIKS